MSTAADKCEAARSQAGQMRRVIQLYTPRLVILEQTAGLKTHCGSAYEVYQSLWDGLGYTVYESVHQARGAGRDSVHHPGTSVHLFDGIKDVLRCE